MSTRHAARLATIAAVWVAGSAVTTALLARSRARAAQEREAVALHRAKLWRQAALVDDVTGIASRAAWEAQLARAAHTDRPTAVLVFDVDRFKDLNELLGHPGGDRVLHHVAGLLTGVLAGRGFLARYGGDEFAALIPLDGPDPHTQAGELASALAGGLVVPARVCAPWPVTLSVGVAVLHPGEDTGQAFVAADRAMFQAKDHRRHTHTAMPRAA
ncbi:hypothetical protein Lfu02_49780 [Longispora fulva]|uniref:Diguanylate cyclase (GGDEF)-like protein n=1 Tax=Longispora fulva TaxID=619741 RepID=A0A8J7GG61_9ACTN|nr:GGDEF domain-containing protein [Longispora fulva]MBG6138354.1 diguanylate cyclase (GGDEF)-like protein [Longispora fulva]GIG60606.1 hypothetical protein Lfu02_49780 [Longispora fulva]